MRVVRKDAGAAGAAARRATAAPGPMAHLAPQEPVAVVAEATFVGTAQRLQGLPAATLGGHGPRCSRSSRCRWWKNNPSNQPPGYELSLPLPGRAQLLCTQQPRLRKAGRPTSGAGPPAGSTARLRTLRARPSGELQTSALLQPGASLW